MRLSPLLIAALLAPTAALAQDDHAAGLFTEARQLPLVSQSVAVEVLRGEAVIHVHQSFLNDGDAVGQADYRLHLPDEASVDGFAFWVDGERFAAELKARDEAETAHTAAAAEGRTTGILHREGQVHSFSVYPVDAHRTKDVELTVRVPVVTEAGRSAVRLPLDTFLGQAVANATVMAELHTDDRLTAFGAGGARPSVLQRTDHTVRMAFSADEAVELWWREEVPPLRVEALAVEVENEVALQLQVGFFEADREADDTRVTVILDGSSSMARRGRAIDAALDRMRRHVEVDVLAVRGTERRGIDHAAALSGHGVTDLEDLGRAWNAAGCADSRCIVVTDAQLPGLEDLIEPALVLADSYEKSHFAEALAHQVVHVPGTDSEAHLGAVVDELLLPTLTLTLDDGLGWVAGQDRTVAEGGVLRVHAVDADFPDELVLDAVVDGEDRVLDVPVRRVDATSEEGIAVRKGAYREVLRELMGQYREAPDNDLKERITTLSLREEIPTAFTSLQVDDPELSLVAIKPGDPILTVHAEPGLTEVMAFYPFGERRRLVSDADGTTFSDRFLVPRGWSERAYRVDVFKRFEDGSVTREDVWYLLDDTAPTAHVALNDGVLTVTAEAPEDVARVVLEQAGERRPLEEVEPGTFTATLPAEGTWDLVVRDRAGNVTAYPVHAAEGRLIVGDPDGPRDAVALDTVHTDVIGGSGALRLEGDTFVLDVGGARWTWPADAVPLRSLDVTATLVQDDGVLLGTRGGDLVRVDLDGAHALSGVSPWHPVTGLATLPDGRVLVGILGEGLGELRSDRVVRSGHRVGSRFVTGVARDGDTVLIGTAYNGLWRIVRGRAYKSRLDTEFVHGLAAVDGAVRVSTPFRTLAREGTDRYREVDDGLNALTSGSPDLMAAVDLEHSVVVGRFDGGLARWTPEGLTDLVLPISAAEGRINDLLLDGDTLLVASEGGLWTLDAEGAVTRLHDAAAHDLVDGPGVVGIATSAGLYTWDGAALDRVDDPDAGRGSFTAVAFHDGRWFGGGLDGLSWHVEGQSHAITRSDGLEALWVTALAVHDDALFVGTYAEGLWQGTEHFQPVPGVEDQWVPPGGLTVVGDALWVGGLGQAPVQVGPGARRVPVAARDVNRVHVTDAGLLLLTSDGWRLLPADRAQDAVASADEGAPSPVR